MLVKARHRISCEAWKGDGEAKTALAMFPYNVEGGPKDLAEARRLLGLAAAQGDANAQLLLGTLHYEGIGGPINDAEARRLLGLAAAQGRAEAQFLLGSMHYECGSPAFPLIVHAAEQEGGPRDLVAEAKRLYGLAAAQGHAGAQGNLGSMHYFGEGGPQDFAEARRLFGLAGAQGHAEAQEMSEMMGSTRLDVKANS